tara:strand:- start:43 stop:1062 length:1020 start_codon:yes stop_codon:yes gene_type:complete
MAIIPSDQQIRTLSGDVDLTNRGNSLTQSQNEVYTMQDLVETVGGAGGGTTGPQGAPGVAGAAGSDGAQGVAGSDGTSINIKGTKSTVGDLPASGVLGDLWIIDQTGGGATSGDAYVWTAAAAWLNVGPLRGPQGVQGTAGTNGVDGAQGIQGIQGPVGAGNFLPLSGGAVTGNVAITGELTPGKIKDSSTSTGTVGQVLKRVNIGSVELLLWRDAAPSLPYVSSFYEISQSGTGDPTVGVFQNDAGLVLSSDVRLGVGEYRFTFSGAPDEAAVMVVLPGGVRTGEWDVVSLFSTYRVSGSTGTLLIESYGITNSDLLQPADIGFGGNNSFIIEVRVFS